jgi:DNA-binding transcriptional ArsR family regulator
MELSDLTPSVWRTCRVLANRNRLCLLRQVILHGPLAVAEAAQRAGVTEITATLGLRALQSRGLWTSLRDSRWVRYAATPDQLVSHAAAFLALTAQAFQSDTDQAEMRHAFTAFTHPRRIRVVQTLASAPASNANLADRCGISRPALRRHLAKLVRRDLVTRDFQQRWSLTIPASPLRRDLLLLILGARTASAHTFEGVSGSRPARSSANTAAQSPKAVIAHHTPAPV